MSIIYFLAMKRKYRKLQKHKALERLQESTEEVPELKSEPYFKFIVHFCIVLQILKKKMH